MERDKQGWGAKVVEKLAQDLKQSFPKMKELSKRNLQYMIKFAEEWPLTLIVQQAVAQINSKEKKALSTTESQGDSKVQAPDNQEDIIVQQPVAQFQSFEQASFSRIPWGHHVGLLDKLDNQQERAFYCDQIVANNWSRSVLLNKLDQDLYNSQGQLSSFPTTFYALPQGLEPWTL